MLVDSRVASGILDRCAVGSWSATRQRMAPHWNWVQFPLELLVVHWVALHCCHLLVVFGSRGLGLLAHRLLVVVVGLEVVANLHGRDSDVFSECCPLDLSLIHI